MLSALAPRVALLTEGTAFKKVSRLSPEKLKATDTSGVKLMESLGGAWGATILEEKYEHFEKAVYGTHQRSDETNDSYLARHDHHFEELLSQSTSFEELRAYILIRQSQLSADDKKRIVLESKGSLTYKHVREQVRLLGSRFFGDVQGLRSGVRNKTYNANLVNNDPTEIEDRSEKAFTSASLGGDSMEADGELESEYLEALAASEDPDAVLVQGFEEELEAFFQEVPDLQDSLVSYLEARSRLVAKKKARGFWPAQGKSSKGGGRFGSYKGKGKSKSCKDQLLARIARSTCRLCGERGHWRAECPRNKGGAASSAPREATTPWPKSINQATAFLAPGRQASASEDELLTALPDEAEVVEEALCVLTNNMQRVIEDRLRKLVTCVMKPDPNRSQLSKPSTIPARTTPATFREVAELADLPVRQAEGTAEETLLTAAEGHVQAILDTGASRCVMGDQLLKPFLQQLHQEVRSRVRSIKSSVKFRFGNNQTLTSARRILLPLRTQQGQDVWLGIEVVPGKTPLLLSKRALKQLGAIVDTSRDECQLQRLGTYLNLRTSPTGLYLIDLAHLAASTFVVKPALQFASFEKGSSLSWKVARPFKNSSILRKPESVSVPQSRVSEIPPAPPTNHVQSPAIRAQT